MGVPAGTHVAHVTHVESTVHRLIAFFDPFVTLLSEKSQRVTSFVSLGQSEAAKLFAGASEALCGTGSRACRVQRPARCPGGGVPEPTFADPFVQTAIQRTCRRAAFRPCKAFDTLRYVQHQFSNLTGSKIRRGDQVAA